MNAHNEQHALPCPFCGAEPYLSFNSVSCGCAASPFIDREDALKVWNTRAAQPAAAQEAVARKTMATCPRDGTVVLLHWGEDHVSPGWWDAPCAPVQNGDGTWPSDTGGFPWAFFDLRDGTAFVNHAVDTEYGPTHWSIYAAPVTAAPANDLHAHLLHMLGAKDHEDAGRIIGELHAAAMRTTAEPGIDLQSFRRAAMPILCQMLCARDAESVVRKLHAALIDASPKGTLNEQFGSAEGLSAPEDDGLAVRRVADHMAQVIDYIDKRYPDAAMLDRGPILRNIRQWEKRLRAVLVGSPKGGSEARQPSAWISDNDLLKLRDSIDDARNIRMSSERTHLRVHPVFIPAMQAGDAEVQP